jgi:hypothetical protein
MLAKCLAVLSVGLVVRFAGSCIPFQPDAQAQVRNRAQQWDYKGVYCPARREIGPLDTSLTQQLNQLVGNGSEHVASIVEWTTSDLKSDNYQGVERHFVLFKRPRK